MTPTQEEVEKICEWLETPYCKTDPIMMNNWLQSDSATVEMIIKLPLEIFAEPTTAPMQSIKKRKGKISSNELNAALIVACLKEIENG